MKSKRDLMVGVFLAVLFLHGCTAAMVGLGAGAGFGTYSYVKGELKALYPHSYDRTWNASLTAAEKLEIEVTSQERDALNGRIKGRKGDGKKVLIELTNKSLGVTEVSVRVGTWGDQEASRKIQETILNVLES